MLLTEGRTLRVRDFDFESKPLWFWYEGNSTAVLTSLSYMDSVGGVPDHDSLTTEVAELRTPEEYVSWLAQVYDVLTTADILTGHNIDKFDLPLFQAQLMRMGMETLPTLTTQDTLRLPKRKDASMSQESLLNYTGLDITCPIGMPVYKDHLSIPEWSGQHWDGVMMSSSNDRSLTYILTSIFVKHYLLTDIWQRLGRGGQRDMTKTNPFWSEQCPRRSVGLTHSRNNLGVCIQCGEKPGKKQEPVAPPLDVTARLQALGLTPADKASDCAIDHASLFDWQECPHCHLIMEPKMITGEGPQGFEDGPGRGELTDWDKAKIVFYVTQLKNTKRPRHEENGGAGGESNSA